MPEIWKYIAGSVVLGSAAYSLIKYFAGGVCECPTRLDGLLVIITGANSGIGKALAIELAKRGANLILACRNVKSGLEAKVHILQEAQNSNIQIHVKFLDLCSIHSIKNFSENIQNQFREVYALVNCAGVFYLPHSLTEDGFEVTFQTNYLGPFILTHELIPLLKKQVHARIVNVSSEAHRKVNANDLRSVTLQQNQPVSPFVSYGVSKLALILFTKELAKKLNNTNIIVNAVNPGNVETAIYRHFPPLSNPWLFAIQKPIRTLVVKNPKQGCQSILHALLTSNPSTGQYYSDCKLTLASPLASCDQISREYYRVTCELIRWFPEESEC
ncbi:retinol dehydrogenase 12-like [Anthonomus grandis grandis]|uniref:retinol dehydrogenase 12-like n=1 Tax=Anthonomus grandis grandis TaxID=2921223 RepID=UPI002164F74A|nr:retinol dehydrogenase 12-like [Anthonomus grandis grandis]